MADRLPNGQFVKGHSIKSTGRPAAARERLYLDLTASVCTPARWKRIVKRAALDAELGDGVARRWLSDVLIGRDPLALSEVLDRLDSLEQRGGL